MIQGGRGCPSAHRLRMQTHRASLAAFVSSCTVQTLLVTSSGALQRRRKKKLQNDDRMTGLGRRSPYEPKFWRSSDGHPLPPAGPKPWRRRALTLPSPSPLIRKDESGRERVSVTGFLKTSVHTDFVGRVPSFGHRSDVFCDSAAALVADSVANHVRTVHELPNAANEARNRLNSQTMS